MKLYHDLPAYNINSGNVFAMVPKSVANYILTEFGEDGISEAVSGYIWVINGKVNGIVVLDRVKEFCELIGIEVVQIDEAYSQSTEFFKYLYVEHKPNLEDYHSKGAMEVDDE